jgi:hypothetical protein
VCKRTRAQHKCTNRSFADLAPPAAAAADAESVTVDVVRDDAAAEKTPFTRIGPMTIYKTSHLDSELTHSQTRFTSELRSVRPTDEVTHSDR